MQKRSTILAWALCLFSIALATAGMLFWLREQNYAPALPDLLEGVIFAWANPVIYSLIAAVIIMYQPGNRVGWLLMISALANAPLALAEVYFAEPKTTLTPGLWLWLWYDTWSWIPFIFPILLLPLHFPTGRPPSPRWRWVNWLAVGMWFFFVLYVAFTDEIGPLNVDWTLSNPIGFIDDELFIGPVGMAWGIGLLTLTIGSVTSLIVRYRRAGIIEKEQIKWLLYAVSLFGLVYVINIIITLDSMEWASGIMSVLFMGAAILFLPVAIAIAILRYRLFDIDIIIRKTAVYGTLSVLLALVYFGSVILLQILFGSVLGEQSTLILVISTLLIAALFSPLRRWLQGIIDRRFFRQKYDTQQVLAQFALTARDETDLDNLTGELLTVLQETLQPHSVTLWTSPPRSQVAQQEALQGRAR